ncbi:MAG: hypothetical protein IKU19_00660, partial [Clostridia bacterium]|nr:hypothetical protein [Clostridia bacterium]
GSSLSTFTIYMTDATQDYFNVFNKYSIYIDDLTIDYSNAVDDREIPQFKEVYISETTDANVPMKGQTISDNVITVMATVTENMTGNYTGLDTNSARVYLDGVLLDGGYSCTNTGIITVSDVALADGAHSFRFEIDDKAGNTGFITRQVVVNTAEGDVYMVRRSDAALPLAGSVEYYDIIARNIENVEALTLTVNLDTLSKFEFEGADVKYGFDLDYTIDASSNTATVNIFKVEEKFYVEHSPANVTRFGSDVGEGEAVLATIPVRVWSTPSYLMDKFIDAGLVSDSTGSNESMFIATPYVMWNTDRTRLVRIEFQVEGAVVTYADGSVGSFATLPMNVITEHNRYRSHGFYNAEGKYVVAATNEELLQGKTSMHVHSDAVAMADVAATCTTAGYTGRTCCEECGTVIDWGTVVPATGHCYLYECMGLVCGICFDPFSGYVNNSLYDYGWRVWGWLDDSYYVDGIAVTGIYEVDGVYYNFDENGVSAGKYTGLVTIDGKYYFSKVGILTGGWFQIEDDWYYFDETTLTTVAEKTFTYEYGHKATYQFYENGKIVSGAWVKINDLGTRYYYGPAYYKLVAQRGNAYWVTIDGNKYAFDGMGFRQEGMAFIIESNNPQTLMKFSDDGVFQEIYTGLYNGYYYRDGRIAGGVGIVEFDGVYYFIKADGTFITGKFGVTEAKTNGLIPAGTYDFGTDGRLDKSQTIPKNGVVDGKYYVNNKVVGGIGLVEWDGAYYYVTGSGSVYTGKLGVTEAKANGLILAGTYDFGATGRL